MKKTLPLVIATIVLIFLAAQTGSLASILVNHDNQDASVDAQPVAMSCGSSAQLIDGSNGTTRDFNISTFLSDEELSKFKYESTIFEMAPGQMDTISHRHDCDVFLTVMEGTLLMGQEFKQPDTVKTGEIFHERRNVIHSVYGNPSKDKRVKVLVTVIRKDGRSFYTPLYPKK